MIEIEFSPSVKQWKAWEKLTDSKTLYVGYGGSAFSGKSYLMCYWIFFMCMKYPETAWGLGRNEITTLKKTTLITFFKILANHGMEPGIDYVYNQQLNTIIFTETQSVVFLIDMAYKPSDPEYTRFGGFELTGAGVDESAEAVRKSIEILFTRTGRVKNKEYGICRKLLETFNPDKGHVYERYYIPYRDNHQKETSCFIPALPTDNPSPDVEDYVNGIIETGSNLTIQRLIYGNFDYDDSDDKLWETADLWSMFTNQDVSDSGKYLTADIALEGADQFCVGYWEGWNLKEIFLIEKSQGKDVLKFIQDKSVEFGVRSDHIVYDADGMGAFLRGWLGGAYAFKNGSRALKDENYQNLKTQCVYWLAKIVESKGIAISCDENTRDRLIRQFEAHRKKDMDKESKLRISPKEEVKALIKESPDIFDMILMRVIFEIKTTVEAKNVWWV